MTDDDQSDLNRAVSRDALALVTHLQTLLSRMADEHLTEAERASARHAAQAIRRRLLGCANPDDTPNSVDVFFTVARWVQDMRDDGAASAYELQHLCVGIDDGFATVPRSSFQEALRGRKDPKGGPRPFRAPVARLVVAAGLQTHRDGEEQAVATLLESARKRKNRA